MAALLLVIFITLLIALLGNALIYGIPFFAARTLINFAIPRLASRKTEWPRNWPAAVATLAFATALPLLFDYWHHSARAHLAEGDLVGQGSLAHTPTVAMLMWRAEDWSSHQDNECGPLRCRALLYQHFVDAVLVAKPPPLDAPFNRAMPVTRYRVEHRAWCPPVERRNSRSAKQNFELMAAPAAGDCLVAEPATLDAADTIVLYQGSERSWSAFKTVHEGAIAERISVYSRDDSGWRKLAQKTSVGGYDWFVPIMVGLIDRSPSNSFRPQDNVGFVRLTGAEPEPLDPDRALSAWGLGARTIPPSDQSLSALARRLLGDTSIPRRSAAMQFLAGYSWLNGWRTTDFDIVTAIIRDGRVTAFPPPPRGERTPIAAARPIIDRILATDPAPPGDPAEQSENRHAIDALAQVFAQLPPCTAAPFHDDLRRLAADEARRHYVTPMLLRIADADPNCSLNTKPR